MQAKITSAKHSFKLSQLSYAIGLSMMAVTGYASETANLAPITVAVQGMQHAFSSQTQSTVDKEQLKTIGAQSIDDVAMYDPSIDVASDAMRAGHIGYNIRGITYDRIQTTLDGIPLPPTFQDAGHGNRSTRLGADVIEMETIKQVNIDKSGNAAVHGNGALGGSVNMQSYSPSDFVNEKKTIAAGVKYGYRSLNQSHTKSAYFAGHSSSAEALLMLTQRNHKETDNIVDDASKVTVNKQVAKGDNILAKLNLTQDNHRLELTFDHYRRNADIVRSDLVGTQNVSVVKRDANGKRVMENGRPVIDADNSYVANRTNQTAYETYIRKRVAATYRYFLQNTWLDELNLQAFLSNLNVKDTSRGTATNIYRAKKEEDQRAKNNQLSHKIKGIRSELKSQVNGEHIQHNIIASLELQNQMLQRIRDDRTETKISQPDGTVSTNNDKSTGATSLFPKATTRSYSIALQDRIIFANNIGLNLALRYQEDKLKFTFSPNDTINKMDKTRIENGVTYRALSPSIRLSIPVVESFAITAGYALGKKNPDPQLVGVGIGHGRGADVVPNPDLKPEVANNFDLGFDFHNDRFNTKMNLFYNKYKNFWEATARRGNGRMEYFYDNLTNVTTYGAELFSRWEVTDNLGLINSISWMKGYQKTQGRKSKLTSVLPLNGVVGVDYHTAQWGTSLKFRWAAKNGPFEPITSPRGTIRLFEAPGYGVVDLGAYFKPVKNLEIRAGVYNLFNKKYWTGADASGLRTTDPVDLYSQPGRNYNVNVELKF